MQAVLESPRIPFQSLHANMATFFSNRKVFVVKANQILMSKRPKSSVSIKLKAKQTARTLVQRSKRPSELTVRQLRSCKAVVSRVDGRPLTSTQAKSCALISLFF